MFQLKACGYPIHFLRVAAVFEIIDLRVSHPLRLDLYVQIIQWAFNFT